MRWKYILLFLTKQWIISWLVDKKSQYSAAVLREFIEISMYYREIKQNGERCHTEKQNTETVNISVPRTFVGQSGYGLAHLWKASNPQVELMMFVKILNEFCMLKPVPWRGPRKFLQSVQPCGTLLGNSCCPGLDNFVKFLKIELLTRVVQDSFNFPQ